MQYEASDAPRSDSPLSQSQTSERPAAARLRWRSCWWAALRRSRAAVSSGREAAASRHGAALDCMKDMQHGTQYSSSVAASTEARHQHSHLHLATQLVLLECFGGKQHFSGSVADLRRPSSSSLTLRPRRCAPDSRQHLVSSCRGRAVGPPLFAPRIVHCRCLPLQHSLFAMSIVPLCLLPFVPQTRDQCCSVGRA